MAWGLFSKKVEEKKTEAPAPVQKKAGNTVIRRKIILAGDGGTGKTSLIKRFVDNTFDEKYIHTIGTNVSKKVITFKKEKIDLRLMIWDVQGQKNKYIESLFSGAKGAMLVCDVTRIETLEHLDDWLFAIYDQCGFIPVIILGNKSDLSERALFGEDELRILVNKIKGKVKSNASSLMTSAKTGQGVVEAFQDIGRQVIGDPRDPGKED